MTVPDWTRQVGKYLQVSDLIKEVRPLVQAALLEDLGVQGDVSSEGIFGEGLSSARILVRERAVIFGLFIVPEIVASIDPGLVYSPCVADGQLVEPGTIIARFSGKSESILKAERTMLNFLGFLSGIATRTHEYVDLLAAKGSTKVLDTRKTLPGWRVLSKAAVRAGGGTNHRMGLYDMVMLKDNHIDACGSMTRAVEKIRERHGSSYRIEVECRNLNDVREALDLAVDVAMLDNMNHADCARAVAIRSSEYPGATLAFEASGDMTLEKIGLYADLGLEYISVGSLTHSVRNVNLSLGIISDGGKEE